VPYLAVPGAANAVIVTSASKSWNLAALKAGLIVGDPAVLRRLGPMVSDGASYFGILAHAAALTDGRDWLAEAAAEIEDNKRFFRDQLAEHLPALTYEPAPGTYLAWLDCAPLGLANPARHFHEVARVRFSPGVDFEPTATQHVRVNLATSEAIIAEAVARLSASVGSGR
jgi:cystathionine beta-lyase